MEDKYTIEITESEAWVVALALFEYSKNPVNEEHGILALAVYEELKEKMLKKSEERFLASR